MRKEKKRKVYLKVLRFSFSQNSSNSLEISSTHQKVSSPSPKHPIQKLSTQHKNSRKYTNRKIDQVNRGGITKRLMHVIIFEQFIPPISQTPNPKIINTTEKELKAYKLKEKLDQQWRDYQKRILPIAKDFLLLSMFQALNQKLFKQKLSTTCI